MPTSVMEDKTFLKGFESYSLKHRPVPFFAQFRAVFLKNLSLTLRQKKSTIISFILFAGLCLAAALLVRFISDSPYKSPETIGYVRDGIDYRWRRSQNDVRYFVTYDTSGHLGIAPKDHNDANAGLKQGLLGWLYQFKAYDDYWESFYDCDQVLEGEKSYDFKYGRLTIKANNLFIKPLASPSDVIKYLTKSTQRGVCGGTSHGMVTRNVQIDDLSQKLLLDMDVYGTYTLDTVAGFAYNAMYRRALNIDMNATATYPNGQSTFPTLVMDQYSTYNPELNAGTASGAAVTLFWLLTSVAISFTFPIFMNRIVLERGDGLSDLSKMMGLSRWAHWLGHMALDGTLYFILIVIVIACAIGGGVPLLILQPYYLFSNLIFGVTLISTAYIFAHCFRSIRAALLMGFLAITIQLAVSMIFNFLFLLPSDPLPGWLIWWPLANYYRVSYLTAFDWTVNMKISLIWPSFLALCLGTVPLPFIVWLLDRFTSHKLGHRTSHIYASIDTLWNALKGCCSGRRKRHSADGFSDEDPILAHLINETSIKVGVSEEKNRISSGNTQESVLVVDSVSKKFAESGDSFLALKDVTFAVEENEVFGLLGPNGAGKSTLVSIMSGVIPPSVGTCSIAQTKNRSGVGICMQEDIFYEDLTVEEHLLYYSRLKGKMSGEDVESVNQILADVSMSNEKRLLATSLSGGMKRRLSVASALCGDPMVLFLDEPSTSLDPGSRLALWEVIQNVTKSRCTLITTHSMDEAEALCHRIGILKNGELVCIGSSAKLKNEYRQIGYSLMISLKDGGSIENILSIVNSVHVGCKVTSSKGSNYEIQLPRSASLSSISEVMCRHERSLGISSWSLNRKGLEELFLSIVEDRKEDYNSMGEVTLDP